jgi:hypothetical protein
MMHDPATKRNNRKNNPRYIGNEFLHCSLKAQEIIQRIYRWGSTKKFLYRKETTRRINLQSIKMRENICQLFIC